MEYQGKHRVPEQDGPVVFGVDVNPEGYESNRRIAQAIRLGAKALDNFSILEEPDDINSSIRQQLEGRVIGQSDAIEAIINAMDRRGVRMDDDGRPIASFVFLGPSGVGKTETAKALASALFEEERYLSEDTYADPDSKPNLIHVNCTEYSSDHHVNRLLGSPPSYVGYGQETVINEKNLRKNTVVLFDEIEKGSKKLHDAILQILGEGTLETGDGKKLSFRDTVVILTSNLGSSEMASELEGSKLGFQFDKTGGQNQDRIDKTAIESFRRGFRPEFNNRLNNHIVFRPLDEDALGQILDIKIDDYNENYLDYDKSFSVSLSDGVKNSLLSEAMSSRREGARSLVKGLEEQIITSIGRYYGSGAIEHCSHIRVYRRDEIGEANLNQGESDLIFMKSNNPVISNLKDKNRQVNEARAIDRHLAIMRSSESRNSDRPII